MDIKFELRYMGQIVGVTVNGGMNTCDKYIGEIVEIKVDNVNGKHSAVFK